MSFRSLTAAVVLAAIPVTLSAFIDSDEMRQEQILSRIDRLKSINGVLVTGRGLARFDGGGLSGAAATNIAKGRDYVGHFQMDVAIQSVPYPNMEMAGSFRIYSELSGFWGSRERIEPREIWLDLLLLKYLGLRMGRITPRYTPFTLQLPTDHVLMRTAPYYAFYQDKLYDAYLLDQNGRFPMDGLELRVDAELGENRLSFNGHVAKVYGYFEAPGYYDRYHFGGHLRFVEASETVRADAVWTSLADLWGTPNVRPAPGPRRNMVFAGRVDADAARFLFDEKNPVKGLGVEYEGAMSLFTTNANPTNASPAQNGFGHRVTAYVTVKAPEFRARVRAGWQSVDYEFVSPAAQNRVLTFGQDGELFAGLGLPAYLGHVGVARKIALSRDYHAPLGFTYAMNEATPNRAGLFGSVDVKVRQVNVYAKVASLSETRAVGSNNQNPRKFLYAEGSASLKVTKWLELGGVGLYETVKRDGTSTNVREDCAATVYGADVTFKPVRKLSLTLSWQSYGLTGRKVRDNYDSGQALRIKDYTPFSYDLKQSLLGATLAYDFSRSFRGTVSYQRRSSAGRYDLDMVRTLLVATF